MEDSHVDKYAKLKKALTNTYSLVVVASQDATQRSFFNGDREKYMNFMSDIDKKSEDFISKAAHALAEEMCKSDVDDVCSALETNGVKGLISVISLIAAENVKALAAAAVKKHAETIAGAFVAPFKNIFGKKKN